MLVLAPGFKDADYVELLDGAETPALRERIVLGEGWEELLATGDRVTVADLRARDHNILNNGFFIGELLGYTAADRVCVPVPFYHCFGMLLGNLAIVSHGSCIVVPGESFDPPTTLEAVAAETCTSLYGVPNDGNRSQKREPLWALQRL